MNRLDTTTIKIPKDATGLKGALFLHIDQDRDGNLAGASISHPGKFDNTHLAAILNDVNQVIAESFTQRKPGRFSQFDLPQTEQPYEG
jgi:hypothetical protein